MFKNYQSSLNVGKTGLKTNMIKISVFEVFPLLALCIDSPFPKAFLNNLEAQNLKFILNERLDIKGNYRFKGAGAMKDLIHGRAYNKITVNRNH